MDRVSPDPDARPAAVYWLFDAAGNASYQCDPQ
jgi:hypothetical protein